MGVGVGVGGGGGGAEGCTPLLMNPQLVSAKGGRDCVRKIVMCKYTQFSTFLCAILIDFVRNLYVLTKFKTIDAKIAHLLSKLCAIL